MKVVQLGGGARWAVTTALSAGILNVAACGAMPTDGTEVGIRKSAVIDSAQALMDALNSDENANITLTMDLYAQGVAWRVPYFTGTLDGGGHTIYNLTTSDYNASDFLVGPFRDVRAPGLR